MIKTKLPKRALFLFANITCCIFFIFNWANAQEVNKQVYLVIGQSNAAGRGELPDELIALEGVEVLDQNGEFVPATPNLNIYSTIQNGASQGFSIGYTFGETIRGNTDVDVGLVVNARGGSVIHHWVKGATQGYYAEAVTRTKQALAHNGTELAGVIWHQGESSYGWPTYLEDLETIIEDLRADFAKPNLPFVAGELFYKNLHLNFNYNRISELPNLVENTAVASAVGLSTYDSVHFTAESSQVFGDRYAVEMLRLQGYNEVLVQNRPGVSIDGGTFFRPKAAKDYYIEALVGGRLAADGSNTLAFGATEHATGDLMTWKFIKKNSSNTYHIERSNGGELSRIQTPNNRNLAMVADSDSGDWSSFELQERRLGEGVYHITAPEGPIYNRVFISPAGAAGSVIDSRTGSWVTFRITEANDPVFIPDTEKTYFIQALNGSRLAADGETGTPYGASNTRNDDTVIWKFVKREGTDFYFLELASGGSLPRLQAFNNGDAMMRPNTFSKGWTSFIMQERSSGEGVYHITAPNGPDGHQRLLLNPNTGYAGVSVTTNTGSWSTFSIIETE